MNRLNTLSRRRMLQGTMAAVGGLAIGATPWSRGQAASKTVNLADIGVGDPGSWQRFNDKTGWDVNLVAIGNAPSAIINVMLGGGGVQTYDAIHIVGGVQKPLSELGLIVPIEPERMPNWAKNEYIQKYIQPGMGGFNAIGYEGKIYGVPTIIQGESVCYLPDMTGEEINSFGALFDPKWRGYVGLDDNYNAAVVKAAIYLKHAGLAEIGNPTDMTPSEINTVVNFLIDKKKEGQFRVVWTSYQQAVDLLVSKEVYILDGWEPMVYATQAQGVDCRYAVPKEGYFMWAMAGYLTNNPNRPPERTQAVYDLYNFMLGPWYGARISATRGYLTNSQAVPYAKSHPDMFEPGEPEEAEKVHERVLFKADHVSVWQIRWPEHVHELEAEWARFKAA